MAENQKFTIFVILTRKDYGSENIQSQRGGGGQRRLLRFAVHARGGCAGACFRTLGRDRILRCRNGFGAGCPDRSLHTARSLRCFGAGSLARRHRYGRHRLFAAGGVPQAAGRCRTGDRTSRRGRSAGRRTYRAPSEPYQRRLCSHERQYLPSGPPVALAR